MHKHKIGISLAIALAVVLTASKSAWAYIDPASGSFLFQILIAALLGAVFSLKVFWGRISTFFRKVFKKQDV